jgi:hypothetical protein
MHSPSLRLCLPSSPPPPPSPLHFPTKICAHFSPVRCISSACWNLICIRLVFQMPSFGLATLRGRLLRATSYRTLRTTKEGEWGLNTSAYTWRYVVGPLLIVLTSSCLSVLPSAGSISALTGSIFLKFDIFRKSVEKIRVALKPDKNKKHFTWRRVYICDISLTSS